MVFDKNQYKKSTTLIIPCVSKDIYRVQNLLKKLGSNKFFLKKTIIIFNDINSKFKEDLVKTTKADIDPFIIIIKSYLKIINLLI